VADDGEKVEKRGSRKRAYAVRGDYLRSLRLSRGWSQREAGKRADVSDRLIRKAEAGGPLEAKSITLFADLYRTIESPVTPEQLLAEGIASLSIATPKPSVERMLRRWFDGLWNKPDLSVIDELILPDFEFHTESGIVRGREELKSRILQWRESFSDFDFVVEQISDMGNSVACRWRVAATHHGPWLDLAPTGRRIVVFGSSWVEVVGEQFGNAWDFWDPGLLYRQLSRQADD
jgi:predicted ester cyclase